jgi:hypothetical protein
MKKWFFLASFIAATFCSLFWTTLIIFAIVTGRFTSLGVRAAALLAPSCSSFMEREQCSIILKMHERTSSSKQAPQSPNLRLAGRLHQLLDGTSHLQQQTCHGLLGYFGYRYLLRFPQLRFNFAFSEII